MNRPSTWRSAPTRLLTLFSLCALMGCALMAHPTPTSGTDAACLSLHIIRPSHQDTAETIDQVRRQNAALRVLCPEEPVKPQTR